MIVLTNLGLNIENIIDYSAWFQFLIAAYNKIID